MILEHLVDLPAATRRASRACRARPGWSRRPTIADLAALAATCAAFDARLRAQAAMPDGPSPSPNPANPVRARSTVLAQAIHHATEHRAQIAGALAAHGIDAIDLDEIDLWAFEEAEDTGA